MAKKKRDQNKNHKQHPLFRQRLTSAQRAADKLTTFAGSWRFISGFIIVLVLWILVNGFFLIEGSFDPFPFILLNLILSTIAAIQAPIILMSQNRQAERDRHLANYDYLVNRKAEREIQLLQRQLNEVQRSLKGKR